MITYECNYLSTAPGRALFIAVFLSGILMVWMPDVRAETGDDPVTWGWQWQGAAGTAGEMPFWFHSNRYGALDRYSFNYILHVYGSWERTLDSGIAVSAGTDVLFRGAEEYVTRFQEGYVQAGYGHFVLWAGRKRETFGLVHPELSMGTVDLSRNARPMPKITFATDGYQLVPGTRRVLYYRAGLSHGWMEDDDYRYIKGARLHQKYLYLRMFTEDAPIVPHAGLKHFAQWGGDSPRFGAAPVNLNAFKDVFFSLNPDSDGMIGSGSEFSRFHNHLGSYDAAIQVNAGRFRGAISRQFFLEYTPNSRFETPLDGLWGVYIERRPDPRTRWRADRPSDWRTEHRPVLRAVQYEYLDTKEGIGRYPDRDMTNYFNYYNNNSYRGGWTYFGRAVGNPLFYGHPDYLGVINNIIIAHHVSAMGHAGPVDWRFFTTYSRNYGGSGLTRLDGSVSSSFLPNDRLDQWSFLLDTATGLFHPSMEAGVALALDAGQAHPDNFGVMLSVRWMSQ